MGKPTSQANEEASIVVSGVFSGTGQSGAAVTGSGLGKTGGEGGQAPSGGNPGQTVSPVFFREFNAALIGAFTGSCQLEKSFDGSNWTIVNIGATNTQAIFTGPVALIMFEPEYGVSYRWNCTALSVGTPGYRISQ